MPDNPADDQNQPTPPPQKAADPAPLPTSTPHITQELLTDFSPSISDPAAQSSTPPVTNPSPTSEPISDSNQTTPSVFTKEPILTPPTPLSPPPTSPTPPQSHTPGDLSALHPPLPPEQVGSKFDLSPDPVVEFDDAPKPRKKLSLPRGIGPLLIVAFMAILAGGLLYYWYYILQPSLILRQAITNLTELKSGKIIATINPKENIQSATLETEFHEDASLLSYYSLSTSYKDSQGLTKNFTVSSYLNESDIYLKGSHSDVLELDRAISSLPIPSEEETEQTVSSLESYQMARKILLEDFWLHIDSPGMIIPKSDESSESQQIYTDNKDAINMAFYKSLKINTVDRAHSVGGNTFLYIAFGFKKEELINAIRSWSELDPALHDAVDDFERGISSVENLDSDLLEVLIDQSTSQIIQLKINTPKINEDYYNQTLSELETSQPTITNLTPSYILDSVKESFSTRYERPELFLTIDISQHNTQGRHNPPSLTVEYTDFLRVLQEEQATLTSFASTIIPTLYPQSPSINLLE